MRLSTLFTTVLVLGLIESTAQSLHGRILSADDKSPVPYASLVIDGTGWGTASDPEGNFLLHLSDTSSNQVIRITCIGFQTSQFTVSALKKDGTILLKSETQMLVGITVQTAAITGREILEEAIRHIPQNYLQTPFNLEFYSQYVIRDTLLGSTFTLESVFESYSEGYRTQAMKSFRVTQKRETGEYFMKERTHGMAQWPVAEVAFNDLRSTERKLDPLTLDNLDRIKPELLGLDRYDGDTVFVVTYRPSWFRDSFSGTLFISAKDHAILMHRTDDSGRGFVNRLELRYRKHEGRYFPYSALGEFLHNNKVNGKKKQLRITNRVVLRNVELQGVKSIPLNYDWWKPTNVEYDKGWWDQNYSRIRGYNSPGTDYKSPVTGLH